MHFERDARGDWVVDPEHLAARPGINPGHLRHEMRLGLVTSRIEAGQGIDGGCWRVAVRTRKTAWQGIIGSDGNVLSERRICS
ncbi:hypothetical protein DK389_02020 [Methylobacterium durans]|uniref:Uncharacterized protein n=2 Tax=Methylobacterium durans TaxID=2202825 RepID=A0A2U8WDZ7_9HYPH|nr:hypothetical protein DK389_02020 [Methylobacterium durans]